MEPQNLEVLNREARQRWEQNAAFWDERFGDDGNDFHRALVGPSAERLLALEPGEDILEIACGNGVFTRRMAELGARVLATDISETFLQRARERSIDHESNVEFKVVDATDESQVLALGRGRFDGAVCNMALMDIANIEPIFSALSQVLKQGGRFVFTVMHPCFNNTAGCKMVVEEEDREGEMVVAYSVKVARYITPTVAQGLGIIGQPVPQYYFHRPLSALLAPALRAGFALDGLEEPAFDQPHHNSCPFNWSNYPEIPPVLAARVRLLLK